MTSGCAHQEGPRASGRCGSAGCRTVLATRHRRRRPVPAPCTARRCCEGPRRPQAPPALRRRSGCRAAFRDTTPGRFDCREAGTVRTEGVGRMRQVADHPRSGRSRCARTARPAPAVPAAPAPRISRRWRPKGAVADALRWYLRSFAGHCAIPAGPRGGSGNCPTPSRMSLCRLTFPSRGWLLGGMPEPRRTTVCPAAGGRQVEPFG